MRWPWRREARPIEPRRAVSAGVMEMEAAKEILAEVFHARPADGIDDSEDV
jgi:hypothetical protein